MAIVGDTGGGLGTVPLVEDYSKLPGFTAPKWPPLNPPPTGPNLGQLGLDFPTTGTGGGGGSGGNSALDQAIFDAQQKQQQWNNEFDQAEFEWKKTMDERDYALAVGDLDLARQKQADANHWQKVAADIDRQRIQADLTMNADNNANRLQTAQIGANAQIQSATMAAEADRYAANLRLQADMANATNDQDRNRIMLAHEQEMARIAKMEDDTKRAIASGEQRIAGFNAETSRAAEMGNLALKNNEFILNASTSPRDLFGLYFMQRGITPDWDSLAAGNAPVQGEALSVANPMTAYRPTGTLQADYNIGPGEAHGQIGSSINSTAIGSNPFINMNQLQAPTISQPMPQQIPYAPPQNNQVPSAPTQPPPVTPNYVEPISNPIYQYPAPGVAADRYAGGSEGFTRDTQLMTGDAMAPDPWAGGAKPEVIENPTGAPLRVKNTWQTAADFGGDPAQGQPPLDPMILEQVFQYIQQRMMQEVQGDMPQQPPMGGGMPSGERQMPRMAWGTDLIARYAGGTDPRKRGVTPSTTPVPPKQYGSTSGGYRSKSAAAGTGYVSPDIIDRRAENHAKKLMQKARQPFFRRYAVGTDVSQQYADLGMGSMYLQGSNNDHLAGQQLPDRMKMLADYGVPVSPTLASGATGGMAPTLNTSAAFQQRGGGMLPSLQTFGRQTKGETENFRGYAEGVVGMPWADIVDYLGMPTQNLGTSRRAMGGIM